ncbi:MAG: hypothetical protein HMLKMBBP_01723 [Planctomycetes bacterium]|nr:hypothetical protein [Planctomycetota bacterium]
MADPGRQDLTATSWVTSRLTACLIAAAGVFLWWNGGRDVWGFEGRTVHAVALGCGFFLLAALSFEKNQMRVQQAELLETMHQLLYGKDYRRDREAIEILMRSLEGGDDASKRIAVEHLRRLTGQNFAADPGVWKAWWEGSRRSWSKGDAAAAPKDR